MVNETTTTILVIEDEEVLRESLTDYLEDRGFRVLAVGDGREGLEIFERERPDLVLTDLRMPEVDGLAVLQGATKVCPDVPLIVVSGTGRIDDSIQALRMGAWDFILKPVEDMSVIMHAVNKALERAFLLRENRTYQKSLEKLVTERTAELEQANSRLTDINTELRKVVGALRESEEKFRALIDQSGECISVIDLRGTVVEWNRRQAALTGISRGQAVGRPIWELMAGATGIDAQRLTKLLDGASTARTTLERGQLDTLEGFDTVSFCLPDGMVRIVEQHHFRVDTSQGVFLASISRDITERQRAEQEKAALAAQLHRSQKMEAIGRVASGVAYDFNNVLCVIAGNAELALEDLPADDPLRESIEPITEAVSRAVDITRQLLAFSRKQAIEPKVVDLSRLIEGLHPMLLRLAGEGVSLRTVLRKGLGRVRVDPGHIEQLVFNLVTNAREAMPGGGELFVETADVRLDEDYCKKHPNTTPGAYVMLAVKDTGTGMKGEIREQIFEPFFTTKEAGRGTGMGLATAFGIVVQNKGSIEVDSVPEEGATFRIYFPRVHDEPDALAPSEPSGRNGRGETVMVVDDEDMVRRLAVRVLQRRGYNVLAAVSAGEALVLAERHEGPVDLLLTDVVMPHMSGPELAAKLTELQPDLKVLYTSGYSYDVMASHGALAEGVPIVIKPFSAATLATRVRQVLDSKAGP